MHGTSASTVLAFTYNRGVMAGPGCEGTSVTAGAQSITRPQLKFCTAIVTVQYFRSVSVPLQRRSPHPTFICLRRSSSRVGREQRDARSHHGDGLFHSFFQARAGAVQFGRVETLEPSLPADAALADEGD